MPSPANPQSLNRYSYVLNNPLKYTDPSGHDTMIVPGLGGEKDYDDPIAWKDWIMASEDWNEDKWNEWYGAWTAPGADRRELVAEYGVNIFNWRNVKGGSYNGNAVEAVAELNNQMQGMQDIKLIAHSKGGMVAKGFMELGQGGADLRPQWRGLTAVPVDYFVLIDPAIGWAAEVGAVAAFGGRPFVAKATVPVITINPTANFNPFGEGGLTGMGETWVSGPLIGAYNIQSKRQDHSLMVEYARTAMHLLRLTPAGTAGGKGFSVGFGYSWW